MRKRNALGLLLLAILAVAAVAASLGHAEEEEEAPLEFRFTAAETTFEWIKLEDVEDPKDPRINRFTVDGKAIVCKQAAFSSKKFGEKKSPTLVTTPEYLECMTKGEENPVVVQGNECTYVLRITKAGKEKEYVGSFELKCPEGEAFEVWILNKEAEEEPVCVIRVESQKNKEAVRYTVVEEGATLSLVVEGTVGKLAYEAEGSGCAKEGPQETGIRHLNMQVKGKDAENMPSSINIE